MLQFEPNGNRWFEQQNGGASERTISRSSLFDFIQNEDLYLKKKNVQLSESSQLFVKRKRKKTSLQFLREQYVFVPSGGRFSN